MCKQFIERGALSSMGLDYSKDQINIAKRLHPTSEYTFLAKNAYLSFDLGKKFDVVSCIYALHFAKSFNVLKQACQNIKSHLAPGGVAVILDITHDYVYDKKRMNELKELTMYEYIPNVAEGQIPRAWESVKGYIHTADSILPIDHIAIHGSNLIQALQEVGFDQVERKPFIHQNQYYVDLWGEKGFNHHLLFCR